MGFGLLDSIIELEMFDFIKFVEAGFNAAFKQLTDIIKGEFMALNDKLTELFDTISFEREEVKKAIGDLLTAIEELKATVNASEAEKTAASAKIDEAVAAVKSIYEPAAPSV